MLQKNPVLCGFHLQPGDEHLIQYWLRNAAQVRKYTSIPPPSVWQQPGIHFIKDIGLGQLPDLLQWSMPLLLVANLHSLTETEHESLRDQFYQAGLSAIWSLPHNRSMLTLPPISIPARRGTIFASTSDPLLVRHYRQIALWAGYDLRSDFRNAAELRDNLQAIATEAETKPAMRARMPLLIIVDLDSAHLDPLLLFHFFSAVRHQYPRAGRMIQLLIVKDFGKPGLDPRSVDKQIRPWGRKIFHPAESLLVLLEALHLNGSSDQLLNYQPKACYLRSLPEILFGHNNELVRNTPDLLPDSEEVQNAGSRIEIFRWYYDYLEKQRHQGFMLSPKPETGAVYPAGLVQIS
ncbi:MAG: hypothetical protein KDK39_09165 [Leptospiraceae bacterium]|nr:hypothetical protein [Leptospiraceae bacterium]